MSIHLPPPAWRAAQARAKACGLWLDLTMDGVFHFYLLSDNRELISRADWIDALEVLKQIDTAHTAFMQLEMAL